MVAKTLTLLFILIEAPMVIVGQEVAWRTRAVLGTEIVLNYSGSDTFVSNGGGDVVAFEGTVRDVIFDQEGSLFYGVRIEATSQGDAEPAIPVFFLLKYYYLGIIRLKV